MSFLNTLRNDANFVMDEGCTEDDSGQIVTCTEINEHKLNLRFEGSDFHRRQSSRRKLKREERVEKQRRKELKRKLKYLKALKRKEVGERFLKLKGVCGQDEVNLNGMGGDSDSDKHDQKPKQLLNEKYAAKEKKKAELSYVEGQGASNCDERTRGRSSDHGRRMKQKEYIDKKKRKLMRKMRRLEAIDEKLIEKQRLKLEKDCAQDELIIDVEEKARSSPNAVELNAEISSRLRSEQDGGTTLEDKFLNSKHKDRKNVGNKWHFKQEMLDLRHSSKRSRRKTTGMCSDRKKKRSFDESLKENFSLGGPSGHLPAKMRRREMYNFSHKSSSFCESNISSQEEDVRATKQKKKRRSRVSRDLFHSKCPSKNSPCLKTCDPSRSFKTELKSIKDLFYNLSL